jgi:hypothetical protein
MKKHLILFIFVFCLFSFVFTLWSQIPQILSVQGVLKDAGGQIVPNDNYQLTFNLYTVESGGTAIWTEVQTVPVADGIFNVILGSVNPLSAEFDVPYWLGVTVETGTELPRIRLTATAYSLNAKTVEDVAITTAKLADGAVTQVKLAPGLSLPPGGVAGGDLTGTYPNPTIAENAVNSAKVQDGTIQLTDLAFTPLARPLSPGVATAEIADNAVTTPKIEDGAITQAKLSSGLSIPPGGTAGGDLTGTYPNPAIAASAVNSTKIEDGQVGSADLANNAVATAKINDGAVTQSKIAAGVTLPPSGTAGGDLASSYPNPTVDGIQGRAVASTAPTSGQVLKWSGSNWVPAADESGGPPSGTAGGDLSGTYPNPTIASNAVTSAKILDSQVAAADLANNAVTTVKINDLAVSTAKIADGAVTQAKIGTGVSLPPSGTAGGDLASSYPNPTVDGIQGRAVATTAPASGQVLKWSGSNWAPAADESGGPPSGTASGDLTGTYPNPTIAANAVTSAKILDSQVAAADLANNAVTTVKINDLAVSTAKIADGAVTQVKIGTGVTLPPSGTAGGDLASSYPNPTVDGIQGRAVATTAPASGQVLKWSGTNWAPALDESGGSPSGAAGGDLTGTYPNPTIAANAVNSSKIMDLQVASADLANAAVTAAKIADAAVTQAKIAAGVTLPPSGTAGGDLSGTFPNPTVDGLQGRGVASTVPASGQVLKYNGTNWSPAADETGTSLWTASGVDIYNNNTGNVGIGTTSPGYKLQVVGDVQVGYTNAFRVGAYTGLSWNSANGSINVGSPSSQPLQLLAGTSVPRIYINNVNGRVGVGTLNPTARIHATTPGRYAGYFSADSMSSNTHVIHSRYAGSGSYDAIAVYGEARPVDGWGYGGYFRGGYYGLYGWGDGGGYTGSAYGLYGNANGTAGTRYGVLGSASTGGNVGYNFGVYGTAYGGLYNYGVYGESASGEVRYAGYFVGNVNVTGTIYKAGGTFKIDHPLDPENKYLYHSFVESPDMKNIYDGIVTLDDNGEAWVDLPEWFGALNSDFRYQLTCIGGYAPVYISRKISNNRFMIAGGTPGLEVSWQVTGIRQDAWAQKNRYPVEELKRADERGLYLHPEVFGQPESRGLDYQLRKATESKKPQVQ